MNIDDDLVDFEILSGLNKNYYRRQGRYREKERIIKLLDSQRGNGSHDAENDFINGLIDDFTALIKGEEE